MSVKPPQPYAAIVLYPVEVFTGKREFKENEYYAFVNNAGMVDPEFNIWRPTQGNLVDGGGLSGALALRRVDIMNPTE